MRLASTRGKAKSTALATGMHAVCLIGWEGPRPAYFGDNAGIWPVRVGTAAREMEAADRADLESPHVGIVVLEYVLVPSATHAKRLKDALDEVLLGEQENCMNKGLRHRWRDVRGCFEEGDEHARAIWWGIVLEEAMRLLRDGATDFPIYETAEEAQAASISARRRGH